MVESGLVEAVIGMAPGLFYNSGMEAVVLILRSLKAKGSQGKVLFINAKTQYIRVQAQSFLSPENQLAILNAYRAFGDADGFAKVVTTEQIAEKGYSLAISQYVRPSVAPVEAMGNSVRAALGDWRVAAESSDATIGRVLTLLRAETRA